MVAEIPGHPAPRYSPQKKKQLESQRMAAWHMTDLSIKDCLMLCAGQAMARSALENDRNLFELGGKIAALAAKVTK